MSNEKNKKQSVIKMLEPLIESMNKSDMNDHVIIILETTEDGTPSGNLMKMQASPFMALGMIDMLQKQLEEKRDYVHDRFEKASQMGAGMSIAKQADSFIPNFSERLRNALQSDNIEELIKLRKEAEDAMKKLNQDGFPNDPKKDDEGFNLNDFKGMF